MVVVDLVTHHVRTMNLLVSVLALNIFILPYVHADACQVFCMSSHFCAVKMLRGLLLYIPFSQPLSSNNHTQRVFFFLLQTVIPNQNLLKKEKLLKAKADIPLLSFYPLLKESADTMGESSGLLIWV